MQESVSAVREGFFNKGHQVPVVAMYSAQGGVGKTTLARKFAELITVAPGRHGTKPNVLLVDLDVEAEGLTYRLGQTHRRDTRTVHEVIAQRHVSDTQAVNVTREVALASGNREDAGELYLVPAAPPDAHGIVDTMGQIDKNELLELLRDTINGLIIKYDIHCVVVDCAPGANRYTAAAATLADFPFFIGRNETATYEKINVLPERFRESYPQFQTPKQRVIINAVAAIDLYEERARQYDVFDYIPLTSDVIHETEGLARTGSLRMLLFENYIVDILAQRFAGMAPHLVPEATEVVGKEWIDRLRRLVRCEDAPKVRRLRVLGRLRWVGLGMLVVGVILLAVASLLHDPPSFVAAVGIAGAVGGLGIGLGGFYCERERSRIVTSARELVLGGPDEVFHRLKQGASYRRGLEELRKLSETIPQDQIEPAAPTAERHGDG